MYIHTYTHSLLTCVCSTRRSVGCTVFEMLTEKPPHYELDYIQLIYKIGIQDPVDIQLPSDCSNVTHDFVMSCLRKWVSQHHAYIKQLVIAAFPHQKSSQSWSVIHGDAQFNVTPNSTFKPRHTDNENVYFMRRYLNESSDTILSRLLVDLCMCIACMSQCPPRLVCHVHLWV